MKNKKALKIMSLLVSLAAVISVVSFVLKPEAEAEETYTYTVSNTGNYTDDNTYSIDYNVISVTDETTGEITGQYAEITRCGFISRISDEEETPFISSFEIPDEIDGYTVNEIGESAFENCTNLLEITIPETVTLIDTCAFKGCSGLKKITFSGSDAADTCYLDTEAFADCTNLEQIIINRNCDYTYRLPVNTGIAVLTGSGNRLSSNTAEIITDTSGALYRAAYEIALNGDYYTKKVFYNCGTESVGIDVIYGDNVSYIYDIFDDTAMIACTKLASIYRDNNSKIVFDSASWVLPSVSSITIGANVRYIDDFAFADNESIKTVYYKSNASELEKITSEDYTYPLGEPTIIYSSHYDDSQGKVVYDSAKLNSALSGYTGILENYAERYCAQYCPYGISSSNWQSFNFGSDNLDVVIGDNVETIPENLFYWCSSLTSVTIPEGVTSIGGNAFSNCTALNKINFNAVSYDHFDYGNTPFSGSGTYGDGISVVFGNNVQKVPGYFGCNVNITSVSFNDSLESIGYDAFYGCTALSSVDLPENLTSIGSSAFADCTGLTGNIVIPDSITSIENGTFYGCSGITGVSLPDNLTSIGDRAFSGCTALSSIDLPEKLESIGSSAFSCSGLTGDIVIPDNITAIENGTFYGCSGITSVSISGNLSAIGESAFSNCTSLVTVSSLGSVSSIGYQAFSGCSSLTTVSISKGITSIGAYAFSDCTSLESITSLESVESIGDYAFSQCKKLGKESSVVINDDVKTVGAYAFESVYSITYYGSLSSAPWGAKNWVADERVWFTYLDDAKTILKSCSKDAEGDIEIPDRVTAIKAEAFKNCTGITSVNIPVNVTSIGANAFYGCSNLDTVYYDAKIVGSVGTGIFLNAGKNIYDSSDGTDGLKIIFGDSVVSIPADLCSLTTSSWIPSTGSNYVTSITIGKNVTSIGQNAFDGCRKIKEINYNAVNCTSKSLIFKKSSNFFTVLINEFTLNIGEGVTSINPAIFANYIGYKYNTCIKNLNINTDTDCDWENFTLYCNSLSYITVTETNPYYTTADGILYNKAQTELIRCPKAIKLTELNLPDTLTEIRSGAFSGVSKIQKINIASEGGITGLSAFNELTNLSEINADESSTVYISEDGILYNKDITKLICYPKKSAVTDFIVPETVTEFETDCFKNHTNLKSIVLPDSLDKIDDSMFYGCSSLETVTAPNVKSIGKNAFYGCTSLQVDIPQGVETIGENAFYNCTSSSAVEIPTSVKSIGDNAFYSVVAVIDYQDGAIPGSPWGAKANNPYVDENGLIYYDDTQTVLLGCTSKCSGDVDVTDKVEYVNERAFSNGTNITSLNFMSPDIVFSEDMLVDCGDSLQSITSSNTTEDGITYTTSEYISSGDDSASSAKRSILRLFSADDSDEIDYTDDVSILFCNRESGIKTFTVPSWVNGISENAFANCGDLSKIEFDEDVILEHIGKNAFLNTEFYNSWDRQNEKVLILGKKYILDSYEYIPDEDSEDEEGVSLGDYVADGIITIADCAFEGKTTLTSLEAVSLEYIGKYACRNCKNLSSVTLSDSMIGMDEGAFEGTKCMTESQEPDGSIYIGKCLVSVPEDAETFEIDPDTVCISASAFKYCTKLTEIEIPEKVKKIGKKTFFCCINLGSVDLGDVTDIGEYAFQDCRSLEKIEISGKVVNIGEFAFYRCDSLKEFDVSDDNPNYSDNNPNNPDEDVGILFSKDGKTLIQYPAGKTEEENKYEVPSGVELIESRAFCHANNLEYIYIPEKIEFGDYNPFEYCTANFIRTNESGNTEASGAVYSDTAHEYLINVSQNYSGTYYVADSVKYIGKEAFAGCTGITEIVFGGNSALETIDEAAFEGCTGLTEIKFPKGLKKIGKSAFEDCTSLEKITFVTESNGQNTNVKVVGERAFANTSITEYNDINPKLTKTLKYKGLSLANNVFHNDTFEVIKEQEATCTQEGIIVRKCTACGIEKTEIIPEKAHVDTDSDGKCDVCGTDVSEDDTVHTHRYVTRETTKNPTCTETGEETLTCKCKATIIEEIPATGHSDLNSDGRCDRCNLIIDDDLANPCRSTKINAAGGSVDYRTKTTIKATATGVHEGYYLAIYVNGSQVAKQQGTGNGSSAIEVSYYAGEVKSGISYSVKVVDADGNVQKDSSGNPLSKDCSITCNAGFIQKLVAFFKGLFGSLPTKTVQ